MALVRSSGTKPEERLHAMLRDALGLRRRIDREFDLPGRPDAVIPSLRVAIFAHGCFWHRCPLHTRTPKSRIDFWAPKLDGNARRDRITARRLRAMGWAVWTVWEHDLAARRIDRTATRLARRLARRIEELGRGSN